MNKAKAVRIAGFTLAVGTTVSLVGFAAHGTGAYFTGSTNGQVAATTGYVQITSGNSNVQFTDDVPGVYTSQSVQYKTNSAGTNEDVWLYFPAGQAYSNLTGNSGDSYSDGNGGHGGLGRYGHFAVQDNNGTTLFSSYNLSDSDAADTTSGCTDPNGYGQDSPPTDASQTLGYCGVPHYILLASDLGSGTTGQFSLTYGLTGRATAPQNANLPTVPFQIVATQHGVRPDASNF